MLDLASEVLDVQLPGLPLVQEVRKQRASIKGRGSRILQETKKLLDFVSSTQSLNLWGWQSLPCSQEGLFIPVASGKIRTRNHLH